MAAVAETLPPRCHLPISNINSVLACPEDLDHSVAVLNNSGNQSTRLMDTTPSSVPIKPEPIHLRDLDLPDDKGAELQAASPNQTAPCRPQPRTTTAARPVENLEPFSTGFT